MWRRSIRALELLSPVAHNQVTCWNCRLAFECRDMREACADAQLGARKILDSLHPPIDLFPDGFDVRSTHMGGSIGTALYPDDATTPEELLQLADAAMYKAKRRGKQSPPSTLPTAKLAVLASTP